MIFIKLALMAVGACLAVAHENKKSRTPTLAGKEPETTAIEPPSVDALSTTQPAETAADREVKHYLTASVASLTVATVGTLFFPPLAALSTIGTFYSCWPFFESAYQALFVQRRLRASVVDAVGITSTLLAGFYWASALSSVAFYFSRKILLKTEDQSYRRLVSVFDGLQSTVWVVVGGTEVEIPVGQLKAGDVIVVTAGQVVPVDGIVCEGIAAIDQHKLTGESQPVDKAEGDQVLAATVVLSGRIQVVVEKAGPATLAAQIGAILNNTADYRAEIVSRGERLADQAAWPTLGLGALALATIGVPGAAAVLAGNAMDHVRIAIPLSMLNFLAKASARRVLIKDGRVLELLNDVDAVIFDKTGTLTLEQLRVGQIHTSSGISEDALLTYAAACEAKQSHPVARAIVSAAQQRGLPVLALDDIAYKVGYGIEATVAERKVRVGSVRFMAMHGIAIPPQLGDSEERARQEGFSLIYVAVDDQLGGILELNPMVRTEVQEVIDALHGRGLALYIISGDHEAPTKSLAAQLGIDHYYAEVLPEDKAALVKDLQQKGHKVCFVGDGINDAIALKTANVSISLRGAMTIATDTAQIVMMNGDLKELPGLFELAKDYQRNTRACTATSFGPAALAVGGIFFLNFRILTVITIYNLSLLATVGIAMLPTFRSDAKRPQKSLPSQAASAELS